MATASQSLFNMTVAGDNSGGNQGLLMPKLQYRFRVNFLNFGVDAGAGLSLTKQVVDCSRPQVNFPEILDSFVREYRKHRDFSDQMLQTLPLFILIRQFMQIGWFNSRVSSALVFGSGKVIKRGDFLVPAIQRAVDEANRLLANL